MPGEKPPTFYLQWNLPNWITVSLMAGIMIVIIGFVASGIKAYRGGMSDDQG